jgi:hypothetical protein
VAINDASFPPYFYQSTAEMPTNKGFQRQTYSWLAQQPVNAIVPNPDDVVIIETQLNEDDMLSDEEAEPLGQINPNIPAICPLKQSPKASFWQLLKTNPFWQYTKRLGLFTGGIALGSVALNTLIGNGQQVWKATEDTAKIKELTVDVPSWWELQAKEAGTFYKALVTLPNNAWGHDNDLSLAVQPNKSVHLEANGKPALTVELQHSGEAKSPFYTVKYYNTDSAIASSQLKEQWQGTWDATTKKFKLLPSEKDLLPQLNDTIHDCLAWLHNPRVLKEGLKQDRLAPHIAGLKGSVGMGAFLAGLSVIAGSALWQFHKRPKPVKAKELSLDNLPSV